MTNTSLKWLPGDKPEKQMLGSIIRVDHAGEYGAKRIYQGQLSVLKRDHEIEEMLKQELRHLDFFEAKVKQLAVRPTVLQPLWHVGGFIMGKITALISREAAMACTVAVEDVICEHYSEQLDALIKINPRQKDLAEAIAKFRDEEREHLDIGMTHILKASQKLAKEPIENAKSSVDTTQFSKDSRHISKTAPTYRFLTSIIKGITKAAIELSKRY